VTVGLLFKMGVAPFHWWVRDVYEGATYPVVALIGGAPKVVIALVWIRIFMGEHAALDKSWAWLVFAVGLGSMYFGHLMALAQERIRALMAYSSLAHMGFVMIALALVSQWGNQSAVFYTLGYGFTVVSFFVVLGSMQIDGRDVVLLEDLKGLAQKQPWLAFFFLCALFSLLGMPPFFGFFLKVQVLRALVQAKYYLLAVGSLVPMVIAAGYYLRAISLMYFHDFDESRTLIFVGNRMHRGYFVLVSVVLIALGIFPNVLFSILT
jgi:NADH-quinone oxidoreductase subunit N